MAAAAPESLKVVPAPLLAAEEAAEAAALVALLTLSPDEVLESDRVLLPELEVARLESLLVLLPEEEAAELDPLLVELALICENVAFHQRHVNHQCQRGASLPSRRSTSAAQGEGDTDSSAARLGVGGSSLPERR